MCKTDTMAQREIEALKAELEALRQQMMTLSTGSSNSSALANPARAPSLADIPLFKDYLPREKGKGMVRWKDYRRTFEMALKLILRSEDAKDHDFIGLLALQKSGQASKEFGDLLLSKVPDQNNPPKTEDLLKALEAYFERETKAKSVLAYKIFSGFSFDWSHSIRKNIVDWENMVLEVSNDGYTLQEPEKYSKLVSLLDGTDLRTRVLDALDDANLTSQGILDRMKVLAARDEMSGGTEYANRSETKPWRPKKSEVKPKSYVPQGPICYGCKEKGHRISDCPNKNNSQKKDQETKKDSSSGENKFRGKCHHCKESGHRRSACPLRAAKKKESGNQAEAQLAEVKHYEYCVLIEEMGFSVSSGLGKILLRAIIDSGATKPLFPRAFKKFAVNIRRQVTEFLTGNGLMKTEYDATFMIPVRKRDRNGKLTKETVIICVDGALSEQDGGTALIPPSMDFKYQDGKFRQKVTLEDGKSVHLWGMLQGTLPVFHIGMRSEVSSMSRDDIKLDPQSYTIWVRTDTHRQGQSWVPKSIVKH